MCRQVQDTLQGQGMNVRKKSARASGTGARTPARMLVAPTMTAFMPDAHTLLTVVHTVDTGSPAPSAACLAGACTHNLA